MTYPLPPFKLKMAVFSGLSRDINIETVDHELLSIDDRNEVLRALSPVQHHWRMIGKHLRIQNKELDKIEKNPRNNFDIASYLEEMVGKWLTLNYDTTQVGHPSWKLLVMAVAKGSGDNTYAIEMAKKYRYPWKIANQRLSEYSLPLNSRRVSNDTSSAESREPERELQVHVLDESEEPEETADSIVTSFASPPAKVLLHPYPTSWNESCPNLKRGFAVIFAIQKYKNPDFNRKGAEVDVSLFRSTFTHLGYEVLVYRDEMCTVRGINTILKEKVAQLGSLGQNHHDSFVCCISAHGNLDSVSQEEYIVPYNYDVNTEMPKIFLRDLRKLIGARNCPKLANKPKLFFIQACRGNSIPPALQVSLGTDSVGLHDDSDFLFSYSTRLDDASCRDTEKGSWYCQELAHVLTSDAVRYYDVCTLISEVHQRVTGNYTYSRFRQCPELTHTLRKRFFFLAPPPHIM